MTLPSRMATSVLTSGALEKSMPKNKGAQGFGPRRDIGRIIA
ncbi:hypothetical protein [Sphingobium sp. AS12]|nr:hypothetical protein [Sphingobium sp. AS12]